MSSVCLSVTLVDQEHIGWKSWKLIVRTISPTSSLFIARRSSTYFQGNTGQNIRFLSSLRSDSFAVITRSYAFATHWCLYGVDCCWFFCIKCTNWILSSYEIDALWHDDIDVTCFALFAQTYIAQHFYSTCRLAVLGWPWLVWHRPQRDWKKEWCLLNYLYCIVLCGVTVICPSFRVWGGRGGQPLL